MSAGGDQPDVSPKSSVQQLFDRALMATMLGQDALVTLLVAKGIIAEQELVDEIQASRKRMAEQFSRAASDEGGTSGSQETP